MSEITAQDLFVLYATKKIKKEDLKFGLKQISSDDFIQILVELEEFIEDVCSYDRKNFIMENYEKYKELDSSLDEMTNLYIEILMENPILN